MRPNNVQFAIMQENLVIVESPAKAKTIEKFLGDDFKVMSSVTGQPMSELYDRAAIDFIEKQAPPVRAAIEAARKARLSNKE